MRVIATAKEAHAVVRNSTARRVLVPTMGALHHGHLELIRLAREAAGEGGQVIVSIFVNPLQFEPGADFERYPRPANEDEQHCRDAGVDLLFRPPPTEMYHPDRSVFVEENSLSNVLCGKSRPGHFRGVCTVVAKLFNLLAPHAGVFGEKDYQQLAIIRRMVRDLDFDIEIIGAPTVREPDGLAASSRNRYLNADEREQAPLVRAALLAAADTFREGETSAPRLLEVARAALGAATSARIDYLELVDAETLQAEENAGASSLLAAAIYFGKTRLIDNLRLG
ncbi:MAG: pantoate--beta-alanine ligase [Verrucomicrobiota bacterium]|nr:pantoate--beta-alanine ligase [Verrucomicrobiota bacterium]